MKTIQKLLKTALILGVLVLMSPQSTFAQQALSVSCQANPTTANQNTTVTFTAYATGGFGNYAYIWSGSDNLTGTTQTISHSYQYAQGNQDVQVLVFSQGQYQSANCNVYINPNTNNNQNNNNYNTLTAYCYANPSNPNYNEAVNWIGSATGGNGGYTYSWSGDEGLYGTNNIIVKTYTTGGPKNAMLTVYSNGQSVTANCLANVNYNYNGYPNTYYNQYPQYPTYYGTPSDGVFLSQVPYTGGMNFQVVMFVLALFLWSCFAAFVMIKKQKARELSK